MPNDVTRVWPADPGRPGTHDDRRSFEYQAYIPDEIADLRLDLPSETAEVVVRAERALSEMQHGGDFAGLESLSRQLLRAESVASSRIEGLTLSQRRLAEALWDPASADRNARAVLGNIKAMERAVELGTSVSAIRVEELKEIHAALFDGTRDASPGEIRASQNWLGGSRYSPRGAEFIPPPETEVLRLMSDLCAFISREDLPAVVQAAVAHAQFETIHPFADGNGRVGRALIHVILRRRGAAARFVPPVSIVLATNASGYVEGLTAYRDGRATAWVYTFGMVVVDAVTASRGLAQALQELLDTWRRQAGSPRADSAAARTLALLPSRPIVDASTVAEQLKVSGVAARNALNALERSGVLVPIAIGRKRNRAWEAADIIALLDNFEWSMADPTREGEPRSAAPLRRESRG